MKFHSQMFVGETAAKHKQQILWNIKRGKRQKQVYAITLAEAQGRILEIYHGDALQLKLFRSEERTIVGLAVGKEESEAVLLEMIQTIYKETGSLEAKKYFA